MLREKEVLQIQFWQFEIEFDSLMPDGDVAQ